MDRVRALLQDEDKRVWPPAMRALVRLKAPDARGRPVRQGEGHGLRGPRGGGIADRRAQAGRRRRGPAGGVREGAGRRRVRRQGGGARGARGLRRGVGRGAEGRARRPGLGGAAARRRAARRPRARDDAARHDPAGPGRADGALRRRRRCSTPDYSPHVFIETDKGTIEFELAVLDAPQTSRNFVQLARKGFFNGLAIHRVVPNFVVQDGDPRGDGQGGPGYTIRDELNERPYLRGTVGMALSGPDTGGSQFFITHSPQPHLDARYTVFGHVVNGMDVVDRLQVGDVIHQVRVWDGTGLAVGRGSRKTRGRQPPPFNGTGVLPLLAALLLPASLLLSSLLCHALSPPSSWVCDELSPHCSAAAYRRAGLRLSALSRRCRMRAVRRASGDPHVCVRSTASSPAFDAGVST